MKKITDYPAKRQEAKQKVLDYINKIVIDPTTDPTAFEDLVDAANFAFNHDSPNAWGKFVSACAKAGVPNDTRKYLWNLLTTGSLIDSKLTVQDAPFCWG